MDSITKNDTSISHSNIAVKMNSATDFCRGYAVKYAEMCIESKGNSRANVSRCNNHSVLLYDDCISEKLKLEDGVRKGQSPCTKPKDGTVL